MKTCSIPAHQTMEKLHVEKGKAAFTLTERLKRQQHFQYRSTQLDNNLDGAEDIDEDETWFEANIETGDVDIFTVDNPGTVAGGTAEEESDAPCPATKSELGNKKFKAQFARRRTHNEQTLVRPCGVIVARATFFGAEAISNVLVSDIFVLIHAYTKITFNYIAVYQASIFCPKSPETGAYYL